MLADTENFKKSNIEFNPNLNTIIGGRSTGKSTLLQILADKLGELKKDDAKSDFIKEIANNVSIEWFDGETDIEDRKVEYFPQSYMHNIVKTDEDRKIIVENIIGKGQLESYKKFITANQIDIKKDISKLLEEDRKFKEITKQIHEIGNKIAIENEISELDKKISNLMKRNEFTETEENNFETLKNKLDEATIKNNEIKSDVLCLQSYNRKLIGFDYNDDLSELSDKK